jgi:hypothetical protein
MKRGATVTDERQAALFDDAPLARPRTSDERARADMMAMIETLAAAKSHPWSARLLGWQLRTFAALSQRLTPIDAAALNARLEAELERLGPAGD